MPLIRKDTAAGTPATSDRADPLAMLADAAPDVRWTGVRLLSGRADAVAALAAALSVETDARVREAIFTALAAAATRESCLALVPWLRSDDASLRTGALDALCATPPAAAASLAPMLLADHDPDVRLLSCEIVRGLPADEAQSLLCGLLDAETEANVCAAAVEVLAELGGREAAATLARCAERFAQDPYLAFAIKVARQRLDVASGDIGE